MYCFKNSQKSKEKEKIIKLRIEEQETSNNSNIQYNTKISGFSLLSEKKEENNGIETKKESK